MKTTKINIGILALLLGGTLAFAEAKVGNSSLQQCEEELLALEVGSETFTSTGSVAASQDPNDYIPAGQLNSDYTCEAPTSPVCTYYQDSQGVFRQCQPATYTPID